MNPTIVTDLFSLACGRLEPDRGASRARRIELAAASALAALALAALWGLAAGSGSIDLAAANLLKVPLVVLLSSLCALPAALLVLKLGGVKYRSSDFLISYAAALLGGTLVLSALAPIVAVYYHTSLSVGVEIAVLSVFAGIAAALLVLLRNLATRLPQGVRRRTLLLPVGVLVALQLAALIQFIAIASPILPEASAFEGGIDRILGW
jgi:hypothetical protein